MADFSARRLRAATFLLHTASLVACGAAACAQPLDTIVVTADRIEAPVERSGSSISVIKSDDIAKRGSKSVADVLRGVAGVDVRESGGVGSTAAVSIRGASPGQTLVLVDGIRIGDPSAIDGSVDFGAFAPGEIERIEVLRGPQSALYGSDAMDGVINIITRKGFGPAQTSVMLEGGSYGTLHSRGTLIGGDDRLTYAFTIDALHADGFPRYGYRIGRPLTYGFGTGPLPPFPWGDPANRDGASGKVTYRLSEGATLEVGASASDNSIRFDNPNATIAGNVFSPRNHSVATFAQAYGRLTTDALDGKLKNQITAFGNVTDRNIWQTQACFDAFFNSFDCRNRYSGSRFGAEYQGDLNVGAWGMFTFGLRTETERASTGQAPAPIGSFTPINASQTTNSVFGLHKLDFDDRLDITYGGRIDGVSGGATFATWRTTASYRLTDSTRLHASAGTGAKAPSLFQRFSQYGSKSLNAEESLGVDAGIEQKLFDDRLKLDVTVFDNRFRNLIGFANAPTCSAAQIFGCYYNVGRAVTRGVEATGELTILPEVLKGRATYTFTYARDLIADAPLLQRPRNQGSASLIYVGSPGLELEGRVTFVGPRLDFASPPVTLAPYAKVDVLANYKVNDRLSIFGRIENLTDVRYQEVLNYGVAGRSFFGGLKMTW